jgi:pyruvate,water dikinase
VKKERQILSDKKGGTHWVSVPRELQEVQAITDEEIVRLAQYGTQIETHYKVSEDIEWAVDDRGKIFILQARPETVHGAEKAVKAEERKETMDKEILVKGIA